MARLETAITNMVDIFMEYADDQGNNRKLCKAELQAMLQKEIESPDLKVGTPKPPSLISKVLFLCVHTGSANDVFFRPRLIRTTSRRP